MKCGQFQELLDDILIAPPDQATRAEMDEHAKGCPSCADEFNAARRAAASVQLSHQLQPSTGLKESIMTKIIETARSESRNIGGRERGRMGIWKLALTAAATLAVVAMVFTVLFRPVAPAYALEQTIAANQGIRSIHLKCEPSGSGIEDLWAQFDENGNLLHLRMNFPSTEDGPKDVVWQEGKAEVWFKAKNSSAVVREENMLKRLKMTADSMNPRLIVEELYRRQAAGEAQIEIKPSSGPGEPITLTVPSKESPNAAIVYRVDPNTKLLMQMDRNGGVMKFLEYNEPIDPAVFTLSPPADAMRIDQTTQEIGLAQGDLTDRDIAVKVAREFFEALIAKDYAKAGRILEGMPAAKMQETFGTMKFLRVVSIGEPTPSPQNGGKAVHVPCEVEMEKDGVKGIQKFNPGVRNVYNHPERWDIFGGI